MRNAAWEKLCAGLSIGGGRSESMRFPDKEFTHSYILMKYRPYSMKHAGFYVWGAMTHNNPFKIISEYMKMLWRFNITRSSNGRTRDFDSRNFGSSPNLVTNKQGIK